MIEWINLAEADVLTVVSNAELAAWRSIALQSGQVDPVSPTLADVTSLVRGYVGRAVELAASGIPAACKVAALDIAAVRLGTRCGVDPTETRKSAQVDAMKFLRDVSDGTFTLTTVTGSAPAVGGPRITARDRRTGRDNFDGI